LGERLGEGVNAKIVSCITPSPSLSPKGERSMRMPKHHFSRASALSKIHAAAAASTRSARLARLMS